MSTTIRYFQDEAQTMGPYEVEFENEKDAERFAREVYVETKTEPTVQTEQVADKPVDQPPTDTGIVPGTVIPSTPPTL
jgi:hypothetical protein